MATATGPGFTGDTRVLTLADLMRGDSAALPHPAESVARYSVAVGVAPLPRIIAGIHSAGAERAVAPGLPAAFVVRLERLSPRGGHVDLAPAPRREGIQPPPLPDRKRRREEPSPVANGAAGAAAIADRGEARVAAHDAAGAAEESDSGDGIVLHRRRRPRAEDALTETPEDLRKKLAGEAKEGGSAMAARVFHKLDLIAPPSAGDQRGGVAAPSFVHGVPPGSFRRMPLPAVAGPFDALVRVHGGAAASAARSDGSAALPITAAPSVQRRMNPFDALVRVHGGAAAGRDERAALESAGSLRIAVPRLESDEVEDGAAAPIAAPAEADSVSGVAAGIVRLSLRPASPGQGFFKMGGPSKP